MRRYTPDPSTCTVVWWRFQPRCTGESRDIFKEILEEILKEILEKIFVEIFEGI